MFQMHQKMLVVEDDETLRYLIVEAMSLLDLDVATCDCADEALLLLQEDPSFALVLTDIRMPGLLDGWGLANLICLRWPSLPVIVSSGHRRMHIWELPPNVYFLPKPWDLDAILGAVRYALTPRHTR